MVLLCGVGKHPKVAETPLVAAGKALIEVLDEVDQYPALYLNHRVLRNAIYRYEHLWIPLLASVPAAESITLVPPLDVEWVWFCHMLCPVKYIADSAAMWNAVCPDESGSLIDHILIRGAKRKEGKMRASRIWAEMFRREPFDILQSLKYAPIHERDADRERAEQENEAVRESRISHDLVAAAARQMAFHYQVAIMPQYRDNRFLRHAVKRYSRMFLQLQSRSPGDLWVPTNDIDLIWRAHMLHPRWYKESTSKLCGSVLPNDDTLTDRSPGSQLRVRWDATTREWIEMFRVSISRGGGMWRGNVEADERMRRPYVVKLIECVTKKAQAILEKNVGPYQPTGKNGAVEFRVSYGGDVNWPDTKVRWVHMTDWQRANRNAAAPSHGTETKVERLTFLSRQKDLILLTCRTLHFIMYTGSGIPRDFRTVVEVFSISPNIPVATAHYILDQSICEQYSTDAKSWTPCKRLPGERMLLLRVGGEDFGLLGGSWIGFAAPVRGTALSLGKPGGRGCLQLRLWLLGNKRGLPRAAGKWQTRLGYKDGLPLKAGEVPGQYYFTLPVLDAGQIIGEAVIFDLGTGIVRVRHATHVVPAYLISMASAALYVTLQPRFFPEGGVPLKCAETMYPPGSTPQHPYVMLQGAGGERHLETGNRGLWIMLSRDAHSTCHGTNPFSGSVADIRLPPGACGGCGGCGGVCAAASSCG